MTPLISICISTRNRASLLVETLESILEQASQSTEIIVLDGASTDDTLARVSEVSLRDSRVRLVESTENGGIDVDYDRAVQAATGQYCWLFSDDDMLAPGAIGEVEAALADAPVLVVAGAAVYGPDLRECYEPQRLPFEGVRVYPRGREDDLLRDTGQYLSFIGGVVVSREFWLSRDRASYFGTMFVHVGVIFQAPLPGHVRVLALPLVRVRFGASSWTSRTFDIWMYKYPALVWSFDWLPESARAAVTPREPWRMARRLLLSRATGSYGQAQYRELVYPRAGTFADNIVPWLVARVPGTLAYVLARTAIWLRDPGEMTHVLLDESPFRVGPRFAKRRRD